MDCKFCKIANNRLPNEHYVLETDSISAFLDFGCVTPLGGHTLIVPKQHFKDLFDTPDTVLSDISKVVYKVAQAVVPAVNADGVMITTNLGEIAGQREFHLHFHVIPRSEDDGLYYWSQKEFPKYNIKGNLHDRITNALDHPNLGPPINHYGDCGICDVIHQDKKPMNKKDRNVIFSDGMACAYLPKFRFTSTHAVIATREHESNLFESDAATLAELIVRSKKIGKVLCDIDSAYGLNWHLYVAKCAGQFEPHLHANIIARTYDTEQTNWPPLPKDEIGMNLAEALAAIKQNLARPEDELKQDTLLRLK